MAKLSEDLKRMLTGLAYQDAGDFLSRSEKIKVLDNGADYREKQKPILRKIETRPATKRIAFISNGRGLGAPLDYAIEACLRQSAQIDLLIHGTADSENASALEKKIKNSAIGYQQIQLKVNAVDSIVDYIASHPSLLYLIAMPDDDVARVFIEEILPRRKRRIQFPIVLIEDRRTSQFYKQSAA